MSGIRLVPHVSKYKIKHKVKKVHFVKRMTNIKYSKLLAMSAMRRLNIQIKIVQVRLIIFSVTVEITRLGFIARYLHLLSNECLLNNFLCPYSNDRRFWKVK